MFDPPSNSSQKPRAYPGPVATEHEDGVGVFLLKAHFSPNAFPFRQIAGYAISLTLTLLAAFMVAQHILPHRALLATILALAAIQGVLQLVLFMHVRESHGPAWQLPALLLGLSVALGIVGFSIWIMMFKSGVS